MRALVYSVFVNFSDEVKAEETAKQPSDDSNDSLLDSLRTILQSRTSNLEEKLSEEPKGKATKLFDSIYQESDNVASPENVKNTSESNATIAEFLGNYETKNDSVSSATILGKISNIALGNPEISPTDPPSLFSNGSTDIFLKQKQPVLNDNKGSSTPDDELRENRKMASSEKLGTLSVHLKNASDTADLERMSTLIKHLDDVARNLGDKTSNVSTEMSESGTREAGKAIKTGQASEQVHVDYFNGTLVDLSRPAWGSGGLDENLKGQNKEAMSTAKSTGPKKFNSYFVENDLSGLPERNASETRTVLTGSQNSIPNTRRQNEAEVVTSAVSDPKEPNAHITIPEEGMVMVPELSGTEKPNGHILNVPSLKEKSLTSGRPTVKQHAPRTPISKKEKLMPISEPLKSGALDLHRLRVSASQERKVGTSDRPRTINHQPHGLITPLKTAIPKEKDLMISEASKNERLDPDRAGESISHGRKVGSSTNPHAISHESHNPTPKEQKPIVSKSSKNERHGDRFSNPSFLLEGKISNFEKPGSEQHDGHVETTFRKHAPAESMRGEHVDDHVRLTTSSVSTTVNGTSLSSIMGVIRHKDKNLPIHNGMYACQNDLFTIT